MFWLSLTLAGTSRNPSLSAPLTKRLCASRCLFSLANSFLSGYFVSRNFPFAKQLPAEETFGQGVILNFSQLPQQTYCLVEVQLLTLNTFHCLWFGVYLFGVLSAEMATARLMLRYTHFHSLLSFISPSVLVP